MDTGGLWVSDGAGCLIEARWINQATASCYIAVTAVSILPRRLFFGPLRTLGLGNYGEIVVRLA